MAREPAAHPVAPSPSADADFDRTFASLIAEGRFEEASAAIGRTFVGDPHRTRARYARATVAMFTRAFDTARTELEAIVAVEPSHAAAHHDLGVLAQWRADPEEAERHLRRALALDPSDRETAVTLAHTLFALDRYEEGWPLYEARRGGLGEQPRPRGLWDGTPIPHGTLAVFGEQGLGDVLQFCRYVRRVRERVGRLVLVLDGPFASLVPLLDGLDGVDALIADRRQGPGIHAYCPMMTLAHLAGASTRDPLDVPYLHAPADRVALWRERLGEKGAPRVGVVWAGSSRSSIRESDIDTRRSIALPLLDPLAEVEGIEWHSLQLGAAAAGRADSALGRAMRDFTGDVRDFADTAALIANLDLVLSVDTSVVHAAGSIGAPVWMLNRFDSCWRWRMHGTTSPWYPSLRIFRQPSFGDWPGVVAAVREALTAWRAGFSR